MKLKSHPIPSFCSSLSKEKEKKILTKLLHHFRRWHDCTECVQQAVKPLGDSRGGVLSPEGFQQIAPTKSQEKEKNVSGFSKRKERKKFMIHFFKNCGDLSVSGYPKLFLLFISLYSKFRFQLRLSFQK